MDGNDRRDFLLAAGLGSAALAMAAGAAKAETLPLLPEEKPQHHIRFAVCGVSHDHIHGMIGAMRSGTTTLHEILGRHPEIFASAIKGPGLFLDPHEPAAYPSKYRSTAEKRRFLSDADLLRAMGVTGRIKSPTYAVVEPHEAAGARPVWHFDFYRFDDPREWEDAGFRDICAGPGLKLAEWPEKAAAVLPVADLSIHLAPQADESRQVTLQAHTKRGLELLG